MLTEEHIFIVLSVLMTFNATKNIDALNWTKETDRIVFTLSGSVNTHSVHQILC